jgi:iron(III) transport system permease protein
MALPLAIPSYVAALAWISIFPAMSGLWAAALVISLCCFPYISIPLIAALRSVDTTYDDVARSLGVSPLRSFIRIALPITWPAAAAGALLVALYTLAEFGTVAIFRVDAFTRVIYASYRASFDRVSAAVLALVLVLLALLVVWAEARVRGRAQLWRTGSGTARMGMAPAMSARGQLGSYAWLVWVSVLALAVPIGALIGQFLVSQRKEVNATELFGAVAGSVTSSVMGAVIALALALPVAVLASRYSTRFVQSLETGSFLGHALPGVVVGLALVFFTLGVIPIAYQTLATLAFAYAVLFAPKAIGSARSAFARVPPEMEQVARSLGRGPVSSWWLVTGRLAWPGIAAGALLVTLTAMKELPATLMLRPTGFETLATELWNRTEVAAFGEAAPFALTLIVLAAVPAWLVSRWLAASDTRTDSADLPSNRQDVTMVGGG